MDWNFNLGWFFLGVAILAVGGLVVVKYQWVGDNVAHGVSSYDRVKFFGIIACIVGFLIMANLHTFILRLVLGLVFPSLKS
ncbi:hypothetical protein IJG21_01740 [Candidatus Saccharibacteria bacterium]|nr:hypothetical protein [Candidatus Saccharibacteria bacterium]